MAAVAVYVRNVKLLVNPEQDVLRPKGWKTGLALVLLAVAGMLFFTQPPDYVDSFNYATHVVEHTAGRIPAAIDPFWDFGHLLWRPLGAWAWRTLPVRSFYHEPVLAAALGMIVINAVSAFACAIFL